MPSAPQDVEEDEKEAAESAGSAFAGTNFSDLVAMVAGAVLLVLMLAMFLLLYINMMGDIRYWEPAKLGQLDVYNLGTIHDTPSPASRKDKDDLLETYQGGVRFLSDSRAPPVLRCQLCCWQKLDRWCVQCASSGRRD